MQNGGETANRSSLYPQAAFVHSDQTLVKGSRRSSRKPLLGQHLNGLANELPQGRALAALGCLDRPRSQERNRTNKAGVGQPQRLLLSRVQSRRFQQRFPVAVSRRLKSGLLESCAAERESLELLLGWARAQDTSLRKCALLREALWQASRQQQALQAGRQWVRGLSCE